MGGIYVLLIELADDSEIRIGMLGKIKFKKGFYAYVGSALNGLDKRVERPFRKEKKIYWHIDYLLRYAKIVNIFYKEDNLKEECTIAKKLEKKLLLIPGFGCSDCRCKSHLFYGSFMEIMTALDKMQMNPYILNVNY